MGYFSYVYVCILVQNLRDSTGSKEGNVLFNDALSTFYLWLYGVRHMVKDHSEREREKERGGGGEPATTTLADPRAMPTYNL